jgi:type VI secretion system secreted protein Hcp
MAFDAFLKIETVDGESMAEGMAGYSDIMSFSFGASNPTTVGSGSGGLSGGKVSVSTFNVMKKSEKASAKLFSVCCQGGHFPSAKVALRKATGEGGQGIFLQYEFTDVMVESIQWSGSGGGDDTPTESVSFAFAKVAITYFNQDMKGKVSKAAEASWDLTKVTK